MQSRPRVQSRNPSRAASPALSLRSRRSVMSSRQRQKYLHHDDLTDDEDSELEMFTDDSRSRIRKSMEVLKSSRNRRNTEQLDLDYRDNEVINRIQRMKEKSKLIRERRSGSLTNWPTTTKERERSGSLTPSDDDEDRKLSTKFRKSSLTSPILHKNTKILSDSASERGSNVGGGEDEENKSNKKKIPSKTIKSDSEGSTVNHQQKQLKPLSSDSVPKGKKKVSNNEELTTVTKPINESRPLKLDSSPPPTSKNLKDSKNMKKSEASTSKSDSSAWETNKQQTFSANTTKRNDTRQESTQSSSSSSSSIIATKAKTEITTEPSNVEAPKPLENWECEHCTFVNESDAKICVICCKTRVEVLKQLPSPVEDEIDINEINDSILKSESDAKQKGKIRKITFLPGTKAR